MNEYKQPTLIVIPSELVRLEIIIIFLFSFYILFVGEVNGANTDVDIFGINKIYPTKDDGREWYVNMDDPRSDVLFDTNADITKQPDGSMRVSAEQLSGNRRGDVRLEVNTPDDEQQWKNVEITGYAKVVKTTGHASNKDSDIRNIFQWYARGGEHSPRVPCEGSSIKGRLYLDGSSAWVKEIWHDGGYTHDKSKTVAMLPIVTKHDTDGRYYDGKWFGLKVAIFNSDQDKTARMEMYVDENADNNWRKVNSLVDKGDWFSNSPDFNNVDCGRSRNYIVTNSGPIVGFRTDYMIWDFKNLSVREIRAPPNSPLNPAECANFDLQNNTINVTCDTTLSGIDASIKNESILARHSNGIWILKSGMRIWQGAKLTINSTDTKWLKITDNQGPDPNFIDIGGKARIDGVKITSWNLTSNDVIKQNTGGSIPRPYIGTKSGSGTFDILNSEIAYLGYNSSLKQGLSYYGGDRSVLSKSIFHDMWYGFYSSSIGFVTISNNHFYNNSRYAIDPHTGSHDFVIKNNTIYNSGVGAICSHNCYNILIEGNNIYNEKIGIMFSRNTSDSKARNNHIYAANTGIAVSESNANQIYNNTIEGSNNGIKIHHSSSNNSIHDNIIRGGNIGINLRSTGTAGNLFENNNLTGMTYAVRVSLANASNNLFIGNNIGPIDKYEYYVSHDGSLQLRNQTFTSDAIRGGTGSNTIHISNVGDKNSEYNTLLSRKTIVVDSEKR